MAVPKSVCNSFSLIPHCEPLRHFIWSVGFFSGLCLWAAKTAKSPSSAEIALFSFPFVVSFFQAQFHFQEKKCSPKVSQICLLFSLLCPFSDKKEKTEQDWVWGYSTVGY